MRAGQSEYLLLSLVGYAAHFACYTWIMFAKRSACLLMLMVTACTGRVTGVDDDAGVSDAPSGDQRIVFACNTIDILFVIDNSNTMTEEQDNLRSNFPQFIQQIEAINPPIKSYRVGVVSTDMAAGEFEVGTCKPPGGQGQLQHTGDPSQGCLGQYPKWLEGPGNRVAADFDCIARLGTEGCGYEQPFASALRALTDQPYNNGFLRRDAPLAIVFVSDEDDCSTTDSSLFDPNSTELGDLRTRCVRWGDMLEPVNTYVDAFLALKGGDRRRVVVAAITGPSGPVILNSRKPGGQEPSCWTPSLGQATPGNRFVELVNAFEGQGHSCRHLRWRSRASTSDYCERYSTVVSVVMRSISARSRRIP